MASPEKYTVGSSDITAAARSHAALVITPAVEGVGMMEWKAIARVRELGRRAVRDVLAADPELPDRLMNQPTVR